MTLNSLHPAIRTVWTIKIGLASALAVLGVLAYDLLHLFDAERWFPTGGLTFLALLLAPLLGFYLPRLRFRFWRYALLPEELFLERGILNRVRTIVPLRRIQHLDVSQDVVEREFDLGKLIVHTAGTRSSTVVLPGLHLEEAERLRDVMKEYILEDPL